VSHHPCRTALAAAVLLATLGATSPPPPSLLIATPTFLMYAEGDHRQPAVAGGRAAGYHVLSTLADGSALVGYDDDLFSAVESVTPALEARRVKTFPRGTTFFPGNDGFLAYDGASQLLRRYDARGTLIGSPVLPSGITSALGVGDSIVVLGAGRLQVYDRGGRMRRVAAIEGNALAALPDSRFAVNDVRDGEVRAYTTELEQTATLRYVGLPARTIASAPDGALAVLAGTPSCVTSDAEVDVFTDLHAQPVARIHTGITAPLALAVGPGYVYIANGSCQRDQDGSISIFTREGTSAGTMQNIGTPTSILPFRLSP
jgi:hypothetical protein